MSAQDLIDRLEFCRPAGNGKWIARCPSHPDKSPSLSVMEKSDGRVLIHCHAGCGAIEVLEAVGLSYDVLFPETLDNYPGRKIKAPRETIDSLVIEIAEHERRNGKRLNKNEVDRYREALKRGHRSDVIVEIAYEMGVVR